MSDNRYYSKELIRVKLGTDQYADVLVRRSEDVEYVRDQLGAASTTNLGLVKLGSDTKENGGAPVKTNSSNQLRVSNATTSATGVVIADTDINKTGGSHVPTTATVKAELKKKANLDGGNTFSGDQSINNELTVSGKATLNGGISVGNGGTEIKKILVVTELPETPEEGVLYLVVNS